MNLPAEKKRLTLQEQVVEAILARCGESYFVTADSVIAELNTYMRITQNAHRIVVWDDTRHYTDEQAVSAIKYLKERSLPRTPTMKEVAKLLG